MLILACVLLAAVTVRLTGGRLSHLATLEWRGRWLLLLALGAQIVIIEGPQLPHGVSAGTHVLTYVAAGAFAWLNRHVRGVWLLASGAACNGVTIAVNGGTLPSTEGAMAVAGIEVADGEFVNSGLVADPRLGWLGDVFAVPEWFPLSNVFSVGDVLIVAGAAWALHAGARLPQAAQRGRRGRGMPSSCRTSNSSPSAAAR